MKTWAALLIIPILFLACGCEKHPASDLQKVEGATIGEKAGK